MRTAIPGAISARLGPHPAAPDATTWMYFSERSPGHGHPDDQTMRARQWEAAARRRRFNAWPMCAATAAPMSAGRTRRAFPPGSMRSDAVLPPQERQERCQNCADAFRGATALTTHTRAMRTPLVEAFAAGRPGGEAGHPRPSD